MYKMYCNDITRIMSLTRSRFAWINNRKIRLKILHEEKSVGELESEWVGD